VSDEEILVEPAMTGPEIVTVGSFTVAELRTVMTRRQLANGLRADAQRALAAAEQLDASVDEFALIAYAKRGLQDVVGFDDDGNILGRRSQAEEN
jgi:hypothetical protein